jgi:ribosomal protein S18 acetylase RimI-like enzyme
VTPETSSVIKRAEESDWAELRTLRLAALADSPGMFGSILEREQRYEEKDWRSWSREGATFLAFRAGAPVGIAAGVAADKPEDRKLYSMWVHPDHRGRGVASALLEAVTTWATDDGATRVTLWVARTNDPAANLYRRQGFTATGESKPLPSNPTVIEDQLALELR